MSSGELVDAILQLDAALKSHLSDAFNTQEEDETTSITERVYSQQTESRKGVNVYIRTVFLKVGEIDTIKETFSANVFVQAKWREPSLDNYPQEAVDKIDWSKMWSPKLYIENLVGEARETIWHTVTFDERGQATAYNKRRVKGTFMESMELNQFPFDTQDLTVSVASELLENVVYLEEDQSEVSTINTQSFIDEQEWKLHSHVDVVRRTITSNFNIRRKPLISASCCAKRRPGFFIWNILLVMLFICSLAFATFTVSIALPHFRLALSFTLVLTTITFKIVTSNSLPKISYLTLLDKYILISMGILITICIWHAIVPVIMISQLGSNSNTTLSLVARINHDVSSIAEADLNLVLTLDGYALYVLIGVHILFHIIFFTIIGVQNHIKQSAYAKKDSQHEERLEAMSSNDKKSAKTNRNKVTSLAKIQC